MSAWKFYFDRVFWTQKTATDWLEKHDYHDLSVVHLRNSIVFTVDNCGIRAGGIVARNLAGGVRVLIML